MNSTDRRNAILAALDNGPMYRAKDGEWSATRHAKEGTHLHSDMLRLARTHKVYFEDGQGVAHLANGK